MKSEEKEARLRISVEELRKIQKSGTRMTGFLEHETGVWSRSIEFFSKDGDVMSIEADEVEEFIDFKFYVAQANDCWAENTFDEIINDLTVARDRYIELKKMLGVRK